MKNAASIIIAICLLFSQSLAAEKKEKGFWDNLKAKMEKLSPTRKTPETTAVGGVRGAKDRAAEDLYWKGEEKKTEIAAEEFDAFGVALDEARGGKKDEAIARFEEFLKAYPESPLREDALNAIKELKAGE